MLNALTADDKYSFLNRNNLTQPIQLKLSKKQQKFCDYFSRFLKFRLSFEHVEYNLIADVLTKLQTAKDVVKCLKRPFQKTLRQAT